MPKAKPVLWAHLGPVSQYLVRARPTVMPSLLVVSLPGSGSSWVGETLGSAADAAYLREPMTQSHLDRGGREAVFAVDADSPSAYLRDTADAFAALPRFPAKIVRLPEQWSPRQRRRRRLVVKEVNPLACDWLTRHYQPRIVFLVRHPMAVAARAHRLGYWPGPDLSVWHEQGRFQAHTLRQAWNCLQNYPLQRVVQYEDLCADPVGQFRALVDYAQLTWDQRLERHIQTHSEGGDRTQPYSTMRISRSMIGTWQSEVTPEQIAQFKAGYCAFDLPWYQSAGDW